MAICMQWFLGREAVPCSQETFMGIVKDAKNIQTTERVTRLMQTAYEYLEKGDEASFKLCKADAAKQKRNLPGMIFSCSDFEAHDYTDAKGKHWGVGKWRHQAFGILNGLFMLDVDGLREPRRTWEEVQQREEFRYWKDRLLLVFVTPSGYGLKFVATCDVKDGNLASHQEKMAKDFGLVPDKSTKDCSRLSYTPIQKNILYFDERLFTTEVPEFIEKYQKDYMQGASQPDLFGANSSTESGRSAQRDACLSKNIGISGASAGKDPEFQNSVDDEKGADYSDYRYHGIAIPEIISAWLEGKDPKVGDRHDALLNLASELMYVCDRNKEKILFFLNQQQWVKDLRAEGDPVDRTIADGLAYPMKKFIPKKMYNAVKSFEDKTEAEEQKAMTGDREALEGRFMVFGDKLRALEKYFPLFKEVFYGLDEPQLPAALFVAGACYGTLLTRTWYHFYHLPEMERRLNYEIFIVDDPASGKSFASQMYKTILSPVIAKDKAGNTQINDYKKKRKENESKSDKKKDNNLVLPTPIIRIHGPRTSNQTFIEDMYYAVEDVDGKPMHLHMFTFDSELENAARLGSGGASWQDKAVFELKAFHNEEDDQHYKNMESINGAFDVFWNFVYTGTPVSLNKKVNSTNFGSGLSTRLAVLPLCAKPFRPMPCSRQSKTNIAVIDAMKAWAFKFDEVKGELPLWPLVEHTHRWMVEVMKQAEEDNDRVAAMLCKRVPYYGINIAAPFILARHWDEWKDGESFNVDATDKELATIVMEIQFMCQRHFFGTLAKIYVDNKDADNKSTEKYYSKSQRLFEQLPAEFEKKSLMEMGGLSINAANIQLTRWKKEGYITQGSGNKKHIFTKIKVG